MDAKSLQFIGLGFMLVIYTVAVARGGWVTPTPLQSAIGFVTAFFDTLGIGSFATTTAAYKLRDLVPEKLIPGTLNVGHALATIAQAFIYTSIVPVDRSAADGARLPEFKRAASARHCRRAAWRIDRGEYRRRNRHPPGASGQSVTSDRPSRSRARHRRVGDRTRVGWRVG